ncbi:MAG: hypothetical protein JSV10_10825 [Candidatus Zixiibacteriota bacterium]|nr:MAG: hypothetical protein JSV10_10825 [candidate division Zixibacteria bacterium]
MRRAIICLSVFLLFFILGTGALADEVPEGVRCLSEQPPAAFDEDEGVEVKDRYGVPRKQVLLEMATGTW